MKRLDSFRDLEQYGILPLTGEACGLSMRLLCDLTPEGVEAMSEFLGARIATGNNWNSSDGQIASIMMPRGIFHELAAYLLIREGYDVALSVNYRCNSFSSYFVGGLDDAEWAEMRDRADKTWPSSYRVYYRSTAPGNGLRNQHMMSGRIA